MSLTRRDDVYLRSSTREMSLREDGAFRFDGIQPGDYYLVVTPGERMKEGAYVNVSIGEADVSLRVRTNTGVKVSGRVVVDGRPAGHRRIRRFLDLLVPRRRGRSAPTIRWCRRLRSRKTAASSWPVFEDRWCSSRKVPEVLLSIRRRGEELAGKTLRVCRDGTFRRRRRRAHETGGACGRERYKCERRREPEPVMVILFPEDPKRWHDRLHQVRQNERLTRV